MFISGQKPGKGKYKCITCALIINLKSDDEELPICPKCKKTTWEKLD